MIFLQRRRILSVITFLAFWSSIWVLLSYIYYASIHKGVILTGDNNYIPEVKIHYNTSDGALDGDDNVPDNTTELHDGANYTIEERNAWIAESVIAIEKRTGRSQFDCGCPHSCKGYSLYNKHLRDGTSKISCLKRIQNFNPKNKSEEMEACRANNEGGIKFCPDECNPMKCHKLNKTSNRDMTFDQLDQHDPPFQRYDGVVIVTKITGGTHFFVIDRMLCHLHAAYNRFVHYDIIVFITRPIADRYKDFLEYLKRIVAPAKLSFVLEGPPTLEGFTASMTSSEREELNRRCNVKENETLTWSHHCVDPKTNTTNNLSYIWQAEFRAIHLWSHEALANYRYMMWIDTGEFSICMFNIKQHLNIYFCRYT